MAQLEPLPYDYDALEPHIDEETMRIHHDKHHQAYFDKYLAAIEGHPELKDADAAGLLKDLPKVPEAIRAAVRNNGGGYVNHAFFWKVLKKDIPFEGVVADAITEQLGGLESFKEKFSAAAAGQFGSGWAWLVVDGSGKLEIMSTPNQDTPLSEGKSPLIALDVWEHAYYLKYQNKRPAYIEAFFNVIDWTEVNELFVEATK
ncbi:MAG: superoxide dismutase [archaeon]